MPFCRCRDDAIAIKIIIIDDNILRCLILIFLRDAMMLTASSPRQARRRHAAPMRAMPRLMSLIIKDAMMLPRYNMRREDAMLMAPMSRCQRVMSFVCAPRRC